jgi:hypothetical protein
MSHGAGMSRDGDAPLGSFRRLLRIARVLARRCRKGAAGRFADVAIEKFRQTEDKRDLIVEADVAAEEKKAGSGPESAERQLFPENTFSALSYSVSAAF